MRCWRLMSLKSAAPKAVAQSALTSSPIRFADSLAAASRPVNCSTNGTIPAISVMPANIPRKLPSKPVCVCLATQLMMPSSWAQSDFSNFQWVPKAAWPVAAPSRNLLSACWAVIIASIKANRSTWLPGNEALATPRRSATAARYLPLKMRKRELPCAPICCRWLVKSCSHAASTTLPCNCFWASANL